MSRHSTLPLRTAAALMVIVGVATLIAVAGLHAVFLSWSFLWPAAVGAALAVAVGWAAYRWQLLVGESIAVSIVAFVVVGITVVGEPTPTGAQQFLSGIIGSWSQIVSATEPIDLSGSLRVVPLTLAWLGATVGCEFVRSSRTPSLPAVGPLLTLTLAVLLSAEDRNLALAQGTLLASAALAVGVIEQRSLRREHQARQADAEPRRQRRFVARVVAMLALVAVAAPFIGPRLPLANANTRFDLRSQTTPPWDPLSVPSPLVELKASLAEKSRNDVAFTVSSAEPIDRWQVAVLGDYDGRVWTVGSGEGDAAGEFRQVDTRLPSPSSDVHGRRKVSAKVTVGALTGPWLPIPGPVATLQLHDRRGPVRANLRTGTMALAEGVTKGLRYDVTAYVDPAVTDDELARAKIASRSARKDELAANPPPIKNLVANLLEGQDFGWKQVVTVRDTLRNEGFYDSTGRVAPGHSYYRLSTFLNDPKRIVGYDEQYAAAAAVMLRTALLPARVVVGYRIPADRWSAGAAEVHSGDITAWVEVNVQGYGWLPVDVTPDRTRTPNDRQQAKSFQDVAVPNPPPPPQLPPNIQVLTGDDKKKDKPADKPDKKPSAVADGGSWSVLGVAAAGGGAFGLVIVALAGGIVYAKRRRRRRRRTAPRPADRISGAWLELADRCRDARVPLASRATPREAARAYLGTQQSASEVRGDLMALVDVVDRAAFHPVAPGDDRAVGAWRYCDRVVDALQRDRSVGRRLVMRVDPRTLRARDPAVVRRRS